MRRSAVVIIVLVLASAALGLFVSPAAADLSCRPITEFVYDCSTSLLSPVAVYASDEPSYTGWATIVSRASAGWCAAMGGPDCSATSVQAWRWSGGRWLGLQLAHGTRVYAWPFGSGWEWVWTPSTGWVAVHADRVLLYTLPAAFAG